MGRDIKQRNKRAKIVKKEPITQACSGVLKGGKLSHEERKREVSYHIKKERKAEAVMRHRCRD